MHSPTPDGIAFVAPSAPAAALAALPDFAARWFRERFGEPTAAQRLAWPTLVTGSNLLLSAPTGTGKTLAAFLPILAELLSDSWRAGGVSPRIRDDGNNPEADAPGSPGASCAPETPWGCLASRVRCVYVAPLKALGNDACRNLQTAVDELAAQFPSGATAPRLGVRTGDTSAGQRRAQRDDPPDVLLTTPESLAVLLSQPEAGRWFANLRWVIVDEVHALAPTKRGADLALSLERLDALAGGALQRIGLSATAAPLEAAARYLVGEGRSCAVGAAGPSTSLELTYGPLEGGPGFVGQLVERLEPELRAHRATLIFTNTRGLAERLAWALRRRLPDWDELIAVHHSALAAARRRAVEHAFQRSALRAVVSSTSLELGIDIGSVDLAVLVHPPGDVVRLLQRVGRAGHGPGRVRRGLVLTASAAELLEAAVTGAAGHSAQCEALRLPPHPLDVLCQQLLGMASAGPVGADEAFALTRRAAPYRDLTRADFDDCLAYLFGRDRAGTAWLPARLTGDADSFTVRDARTARLLRRNLGTILAEETTAVVTEDLERLASPCSGGVPPPFGSAAGSRRYATVRMRPVGEVDRAFAEGLNPGERFLLDGRCLEVRHLTAGTLVVEEAAGRPATPRWRSDGWPLSTELAERLYLLRVRAAEALRDGPAALAGLLRRDYGLGDDAAAALAAYFERQEALSEIPDGDGVLVERVGDGAFVALYVHTPLNRTANDALARVAVRRLARDHGRAADSVVADLGFAILLHAELPLGVPELLRALLTADGFAADLDAALAESVALRERFQRVARTGLMLLRNPLGGRRKVGGHDWGGRQLFDQVRARDADFVLLRQALREVRADLCDGAAAQRFAVELPRRPVKCRHLQRTSPFAEGWTQAAPGATEETETPAEALQRLHASLTGAAEVVHARLD